MGLMLKYWARLYNNMTPAEQALEPAVAALGERYRTQYPFFGLRHIADFALLDRKLIIEVDGASHDHYKQKHKDLQHMLALEARGWSVYRCSNLQATVDPEGTVRAALAAPRTTREGLQEALAQLLLDHPDLPVALAMKSKPELKRHPKIVRAKKIARNRAARLRARQSQESGSA